MMKKWIGVVFTLPQHFTTQSQILMTLYERPFENFVGKGENAGNR